MSPIPRQSAPSGNFDDSDNLTGFKALFQHATLGIIIVDEEGIIKKSNPYLLKLFGYEPGEIIGANIEKLIPDRYKKSHVGHRESYSKNPKSRPMGIGMDLYGMRKDGKEFPVEISLSNYKHKGNRYTVAFVSDITEKVEAENELNKERDRANLFFNIANVIMVNIGKDQLIKDINEKGCEIIGYGREEILGENWFDLLIPEEERKETKAVFKSLIDEDLSPAGNFENSILTKSGEAKVISWHNTPLKDGKGNIIGTFSAGTDITLLKETERWLELGVEQRTYELTDALKREKELNELKSQFVSLASHEFRTPLSAINSSTILANKYIEKGDTEKLSKNISRIQNLVGHLNTMLEDFLSVAKVEEGKVDHNPVQVDLHDMILNIIEDLDELCSAGQYVDFEHKGNKSAVIDRKLLRNVIINLISNAIKYSEKPVRVIVDIDEESVELSVEDKGIGIPKEDQEKMFSRFFRASNVGEIKGTGLGINIVKGYVERMNGDISFKSKENSGTTFQVKIPNNNGLQEKKQDELQPN